MTGGRNGAGGWPFVGRADPVGEIVAAINDRSPGGVFLTGPPGAGRTRATREAGVRLTASGHPVTFATASRSAAGVAFGALSLPTAWTDGGRAGVGPTGDPAATVRAVVAALRPVDGRQPILIVDDAHLLDGPSAALVQHLAAAGHVAVVLTAPVGVPVPDALWSLDPDRPAHRVDLAPLDPAAVDAILGRVLGGPLDGLSRRRLHRLCAGNPRMLRDLVDVGLRTGSLWAVDGVWRWRPPRWSTCDVPDVIADHLAVTEPDLRAALELIACADPLPQVAADRMTGLVEAERRGIVVAGCVGRRALVRFAVPAHGLFIRAGLCRLRERAIVRELLELHEEIPRRRAEDVVRRALWRLRAGLPVSDADLLAASRTALARSDLDGADRLARAALPGGGPTAAVVLAEVLLARGRADLAVAVLPSSTLPSSASTGSGSVAELWPNGMDRAAALVAEVARHRVTGRPADGRSDDPAVSAVRAWHSLLAGGVQPAVAAGAAGAGAAAGEGVATGPSAAGYAAMTITLAGALAGDLRAVGDPPAPVPILGCGDPPGGGGSARGAGGSGTGRSGDAPGCVRAVATLLVGSLAVAAGRAEAGYAAALGDEPAMVGHWAAVRGMVARSAGSVREAQRALHEAVVLLDGEGGDPARLYLAELAGAYAMGGAPVEAGAWLERADRYTSGCWPILDPWVERNRAWVTAANGDVPRAVGQALHAADLAAAAGQVTVEAAALFDVARLGAAVEVDGRLRALAARIAASSTASVTAVSTAGTVTAATAGVTGTVAVFAQAATALAGDAQDLLDPAIDALRDLGYLLPAAELAMAAHRSHAAAGRYSAGRQVLARARDLLHACEGACPPLLDAGEVRGPLTDRESQIARLAADGLTGQAIASQLNLSLRTVNNHLSRTYAKLGVTGRPGLADLFGTRGRAGR